MKKASIFILGVFILCFSVTCRKKNVEDDCPVCPNISGFSPSHGKNGDTITVMGENFTTNPDGLKLKASINGQEAVIASIPSDKQAKLIVPNKCGTGRIKMYYDAELYSESSAPFIYDRLGVVYTVAGKCGSATDPATNSNPLESNLGSTERVFLDEPRGIIYVIGDNGKKLVRINSGGAKELIDVEPLILKSGACDASGNIYLAVGNYIAKFDNSVSPTLVTIAGSITVAGHTDGKGTLARFESVNHLIIDGNTMYIGEAKYVRKMDLTTLNVTTLAGSASSGFADGPALSAKFNSIVSMALDKNQNLYIADWENSRIRKLSNGVVSTLAGDGTEAIKNGTGTAAQLQKPRSLVINNEATFIYFSDSFTSFIRKIDMSNSEVSYFAGDITGYGDQNGPVETALFFQPRGFVYSKTADLFYIADYFNCKIKKISFE